MSAQDLSAIQATFLRVTPEFNLRSSLIFILDEIHKVPGWEEYVIELSRNPHWKVVVTGSSSKLLREDIATELRGKSISSTLYPLSFSEFLKFRNYNHDPASTKGGAEAARMFDEYLAWGGYPALTDLVEYSREQLLREYFDTMILRDIIQRYNVSKPQQCIQLYRFLMSNISRPHTLQSAYEYLRSCDYSTSRDSIRDYLRWAEDSWLIFSLPIYSQSHKEQERNYRKIYSIDWALALRNSTVWDGSYSRALENMVFLQLRRNYDKIFYYLTRSGRQEVDFLPVGSNGRPETAIQVCMSLAGQETADREIKPLVATCKYFGIDNAQIITVNEQQSIQLDQLTIEVVPAWKWLLTGGKVGA
jgi:predicted AAA+ superfamily ATPase